MRGGRFSVHWDSKKGRNNLKKIKIGTRVMMGSKKRN